MKRFLYNLELRYGQNNWRVRLIKWIVKGH